jgi:3-phosphoshikimate 1-carboxyvinyltransferase
VDVVGENAEESPYVAMTSELLRVFPARGGGYAIEPDASSGSYFWAAGALPWPDGGGGVSVPGWPATRWQIDADFPRYLPLPAELSRQRHLGDSILTAMILAPFAPHPVRFTDLGRLRLQECERVAAMRTELAKCGAVVTESGDTLEVRPGSLHGGTIQTYDDHRLAMCFAILGLKVPGIRLQNPACVNKTFPSFFLKLAEPVPGGLGARILDAATGRALCGEALQAA